MRYLLTFLFVAANFLAIAQAPTQVYNGNLYKFNFGQWTNGSLFVPRDTSAWVGSMGDSGRIAFKNRVLYYNRGGSWVSLLTSLTPIVTSVNGQVGAVTLSWQQVMNEGSSTSNVPVVARDDEGYRIQQATAVGTPSKNNTIRWTSGLNLREFALLGFRQAVSNDSTFFILNDVGNVDIRGTGGFNAGSVNGGVIWNAGNDVAGSAFSPTLTGASVLATFSTTSTGRVNAVTTRTLTAANIGALSSTAGLNDVMLNSGTTTVTLTFNRTNSASNQLMNLQNSYGLYSDNTGTGSANSRLWFDGPDRGDFIIGPRMGPSYFNSIRLKGNATVDSFLNVGGTTKATSMLQTTSFAPAITTTGVNLSLTEIHYTIIATTSGITLTLPTASTCRGRIYVIQNNNTGGSISTSTNYTPANGVATNTIALNTNVWLQSDGTIWRRINN